MIIDLLIPVRILDTLGGDELATLAGYMNFVEVMPGEVVFKEGDNGDYFCFLADGVLEVFKSNEKGENVLLTTLKRGNSLGEMAVIENSPRSATVIARTEATLVTLTNKAFNDILKTHPLMGIKILKGIARLLSQNLRYTSATLADNLLPVT